MHDAIRTPNPGVSRTRLERWMALLSMACVTFGTTSCSEPTRASFLLEPGHRLQSLEVNYPAVNLALVAPYDTVTLRAIARNALGEQLPDSVTIAFTTTARQVAVNSAGLVRALAQTSAAGVTITMSATYQGVTRTSETRIVVTAVASPPHMDSFSFGNPFTDTLEIGPSVGFGKPAMTLTPVAKTSSGGVIPRLVYAYRSSNGAAVAIGSPSSVWATTTGQVSLIPGPQAEKTAIITATARVYGVIRSDSVVVRLRREPGFASVVLSDTMSASAPEIVLARGGDVYWFNTSSRNAIGITFDPAAEVKAPSQETMAALLIGWMPDSGNIAPFMRDTIASPGDDFPQLPPASMTRGRSFPTPGRYRWRTTRSPAVEGTIVVR